MNSNAHEQTHASLEPSPSVSHIIDFSLFETVVDVGGGTGHLLTAVLQRYPKVRGVLAELPHVLGEAQKMIESRGLKGRCRIEPTDFFRSVPSGGDA